MIIDNNLLTRWSVPGDKFGNCIVLDDPNLVYINIPKNASTWTKHQLSTLVSKRDNYFINQDLVKKPMLVMLREPIERWISGISWYMTYVHPNLINSCNKNQEVQSVILTMVSEKIDFDGHTTPQSNFLQGINLSNVTFIRVKHNTDVYCETFSKFFTEELGVSNSFNTAPSQHVAVGNPIQIQWVKFFQSALNTTLLEKLHRYYRDDINLYNSTKFYE